MSRTVVIRRVLLIVALLATLALSGASTAEAGGCYRSRGYYGGPYYGGNSYRTVRYPRVSPSYYRYGPPVYRSRSYYGGPGFYPGYRSGVSLSFGF